MRRKNIFKVLALSLGIMSICGLSPLKDINFNGRVLSLQQKASADTVSYTLSAANLANSTIIKTNTVSCLVQPFKSATFNNDSYYAYASDPTNVYIKDGVTGNTLLQGSAPSGSGDIIVNQEYIGVLGSGVYNSTTYDMSVNYIAKNKDGSQTNANTTLNGTGITDSGEELGGSGVYVGTYKSTAHQYQMYYLENDGTTQILKSFSSSEYRPIVGKKLSTGEHIIVSSNTGGDNNIVCLVLGSDGSTEKVFGAIGASGSSGTAYIHGTWAGAYSTGDNLIAFTFSGTTITKYTFTSTGCTTSTITATGTVVGVDYADSTGIVYHTNNSAIILDSSGNKVKEIDTPSASILGVNKDLSMLGVNSTSASIYGVTGYALITLSSDFNNEPKLSQPILTPSKNDATNRESDITVTVS